MSKVAILLLTDNEDVAINLGAKSLHVDYPVTEGVEQALRFLTSEVCVKSLLDMARERGIA